MYLLACLAVFFVAYLVNTTTITVLYHRGLAHGAVSLSPRTRRFAGTMGIWLTGLDPKGWVSMHRAHHAYSDTPRDPHSPVHYGLFGVLLAQLRSYERTLVGLAKGKPAYCDTVADLDFPISWPTRRGLWFLPYLVHLAIALSLGLLAVGARRLLLLRNDEPPGRRLDRQLSRPRRRRSQLRDRRQFAEQPPRCLADPRRGFPEQPPSLSGVGPLLLPLAGVRSWIRAVSRAGESRRTDGRAQQSHSATEAITR